MSPTDPRYPIGQFVVQPHSKAQKEEWLADIKFLPNAVELALQNLDESQLQTPYREGGWTVHQVVHHLADSHMHAYLRCKFAYTENNPTIMAYKEQEWAQTSDVQNVPVNMSVTLLFALHARWHEFLSNLTDADWEKTVFHPGHQKTLSLWQLLGMYAWHGKHHTAHIMELRQQKGWL